MGKYISLLISLILFFLGVFIANERELFLATGLYRPVNLEIVIYLLIGQGLLVSALLIREELRN